MERNTTVAALVDVSALVDEAFQQVGESFDRFCLTAGGGDAPEHAGRRRGAAVRAVACPRSGAQRPPGAVDGDGVRVGYSLRALCDVPGGMEMRLISCLPAAAPDALMSRPLHHLAVEYRNWAVLATAEQREPR